MMMPSFEENTLTLGGKSYPNYVTFIFTSTVTFYMKSDICLHYQDVKENALPSKKLFELSDNLGLKCKINKCDFVLEKVEKCNKTLMDM